MNSTSPRGRRGASDALLATMRDADPNDPIQIADRTWWVGHYLEGDPFQCHVYLIENGDQSVLIDPGSQLTIEATLRKVERVTGLGNVRYFVCHHQDPDITAAMPTLDRLVDRPDAVLVSHWRGETLIRHYGLRMPFWRVEANDWQLDLPDRRLRFVFTPYLHFPGAFCTYDELTGVLFSSDLFGGFTRGFSLVAEDESHFDAIRPFHEHYMPSREILAHGMSRLEKLDIEMIAPQHGSIIPRSLVATFIDRLKGLDCGLYLLLGTETDIDRLVRLNEVLHGIVDTMLGQRDFSSLATALLAQIRRIIDVTSIEFWASTNPEASVPEFLRLSGATGFRGTLTEPPEPVRRAFGGAEDGAPVGWNREPAWPQAGPAGEDAQHQAIVLPLHRPEAAGTHEVAVLHLAAGGDAVLGEEEVDRVLHELAVPLQVAVERESIYQLLDREREAIYNRAIRDPLTGLYTRLYMQDAVARLLRQNDRHPEQLIGVLMLDVDHFKSVNDTWGHAAGDGVLRRVGEVVLESMRTTDLPVRLGGEEFALFCTTLREATLDTVAERIRAAVAAQRFDDPLGERTITVSCGTAIRREDESLPELLERADQALYAAKTSGRDRVCAAA